MRRDGSAGVAAFAALFVAGVMAVGVMLARLVGWKGGW